MRCPSAQLLVEGSGAGGADTILRTLRDRIQSVGLGSVLARSSKVNYPYETVHVFQKRARF
jgi:hypothetical protein